jgi:serine protease Do
VLRALDRAVSSAESLQKLLFAEAIGQPFPLTVLREGKALKLTAVPSEMTQPD